MFSRIVKWLFSATPVIQITEKKEESQIEKLIKLTEKLMSNADVSKEVMKPDSKIYPIHVYTTSVSKIIDLGKAVYYIAVSKNVNNDSYLPMSPNRVMIDLGNYLKFGNRIIDITFLLENILTILTHFNDKKTLSYREKFILEDIICLLDVFCYLIGMEKENTWNN